MESKTPGKFRRIFLTSRFITISILIHVLVVSIIGGRVLFNRYVEQPAFVSDAGDTFVTEEAKAQPPPAQSQQTPQFNVTTASVAPQMDAITALAPTQASFTLPSMPMPQALPKATSLEQTSMSEVAPKMAGGMSLQTAKGIAAFTGNWAVKGSGEPGSPLRSRRFQFSAYLAKYGNPNDPLRASGDWDSTVRVVDGKIAAGSLPNLLYVIDKLSTDKIQTSLEPVPLDLSNWEAIMAKKPPFILFTGHRDFVLTDTEVDNLRKYLMLGGCIWGDSSLPGRRSRFDIAFRREMRRVVPDIDKSFEPLPPDHPIFTKTYYPDISAVPPGMNYYKEPIYVLKVYDEIAILYTANDYGDMWQIGIDEKGEIDMRRDEHGNFVAINRGMWDHRDTYFRNISDQSLFATYKFATNIIVHLLTRWESKVRNVPHQ